MCLYGNKPSVLFCSVLYESHQTVRVVNYVIDLIYFIKASVTVSRILYVRTQSHEQSLVSI